ncbi:MAG: T9SS type A sorting domain-containing protein [Bacteroidales bacterium]|jgi:hypothetical protein|nr:T9SS type A sorting domain-containing protein [Bacteroidales bacterium]MDD4213876.1 T9SS type A sorting domain-containing protein [Bacteroidales bacterium]
MKKRILLFSFICAMTAMYTYAQQDTIVAWTFPTGNLTDTVADAGIAGNIGSRTIMHEGGTGVTTMVPGDGTYAEEVTGWDNGDNVKFWSIKFKAENYHDLVLYSKQKSDATDFGPKDWKVQYKVGSSGTWTDITSGTIVCTNDWTGGVVNALAIPITTPGSNSIYIRWIMTSNTATNDVDVLATGKSAIDNIVIMGTADLPVETGDTIVGFNFADTTDTEFNADFGLSGNLTYNIQAEDTGYNDRPLTYTNGYSDYAATATGWDGGDSVKFWSIKFKANGYKDMKVWSKQRSDGTNPGPKDWKLQCRLSGGEWEDIPGGNITVANDWTTGVVSELALPATMNDPGTTSIYIRWIMTSNESSSGSDVLPTGISKIDDILVTGTLSGLGISSVIYENNVGVYPNPCADILNINSSEEIAKTEIYNMLGAKVYSKAAKSNDLQINVNQFEEGLYLVVLHFNNETKVVTRKIIIK